MRIYQHLNPEGINPHPVESTRARISCLSDLDCWFARNNQTPTSGRPVTVTFVIDTHGWLWVADRHSEHYCCAAGGDVQSAGEMTFDLVGAKVEVAEVTNQSIGYCPEPESWRAVATALERAGVPHPGRFTVELVFRRCVECGRSNVVKDGSYECGVCGVPLDPSWNFGNARE